MNLKEKLKKQQYDEIWQQYCGFLDLTMDGFMKIQKRLMEEQIQLWSRSGLGQSILKGKYPQNLEEFRQNRSNITVPIPSRWSLNEKDGSPDNSRPFILHNPIKFKITFLFCSVKGIYVFPIIVSFGHAFMISKRLPI